MLARDLLNDYVDKIVESVDPDVVVLFGSHARNQAVPESDIDLLIVHSGTKRRDVQRQAYFALTGRSIPVDIIVRSPAELQERLSWPDPFVSNLVKEGKVLYGKPHSPGMALFRPS